MKKNIYKNLLLAALTLFATACQNDDFGSAYENDPNAVIVNASIGALKTRVSTESAESDKWDNNDSFGVTGGATDKTATYKYSSGTWTLTSSDYLTWDAGENNFKAWYPTRGTYIALSVLNDQSTEIGSSDWMTTTATIPSKPTDKKLNLVFNHKLSKVIVNVTAYGSEFNNVAPTISNVKFYVAQNPTVEGATMQKTGTPVTPFASTQNDGKPCYTAILLPGTYSAGTFIEMTVTSGGSSKTLIVAVPSALQNTGLLSGKAYTYNLTVGKSNDAIKIASMSVNAWGAQNIGIGEATDDAIKYRIGSLYPNDENPIGIVFWVNPDDEAHGKVLSLDEGSAGAWAKNTSTVSNLSDGENNGKVNTEAVKQMADWETNFPHTKWCTDKGDGWYQPSYKELTNLVKALKIVDLNEILNTISATPISNGLWCLSESSSPNTATYAGRFKPNGMGYDKKTTEYNVRAVREY